MFALPFLDIPPLDGAEGTVRLPGSKSISNRILLLAALAQGETRIHDVLDSDDTRYMLEALRKLDPRIQWHNPVMFVVFLGTIVTAPLAVAVVVSVHVVPEPVTVTAEPLVTVKSAAAIVVPSSASFEVSVNCTVAPFVGSAWPAAWTRVSVGVVES